MLPYRAWRLYCIHSSTTKETTTMAIKLIANYSKRLGLPGYSSHQFEVSIETEISNTSELPFETERLYGSLQAAVDAQIQQVGFVPDEHYGSQVTQRPALGASCSQMISTSSVKQRLQVLPRPLLQPFPHGSARKSNSRSSWNWPERSGWMTLP